MEATLPSRNGHSKNGQAKRRAPEPASPRNVTVGEIARLLNAELVGDARTLITGVASLDSATPGSIAFVEHDHLLQTALDSSASAIIAPSSSGREAQAARRLRGAGGQAQRDRGREEVLRMELRVHAASPEVWRAA